LKIQRAAGHDDLRTTQRYINEAQTFEGDLFGEPLPISRELSGQKGRTAGSALTTASAPAYARFGVT
jgi:hypothetical protein